MPADTWRQAAHERVRRWLDLPMIVLSLGFVVVLIAPDVDPHMGSSARSAFTTADYGLWAAFAAEYVALVVTAPERWTYVKRHPLDLALVAIPMLRPLRALRMLRVLAAIGSAAQRSQSKFLSRAALAAAVTAAVMVMLVAATVLDVERHAKGSNLHTFSDALWWAASTITTVGYGDHYPVTGAGRLMAVVLMLTGIAMLGIVTAAVAAWFVRITGSGQDDQLRLLTNEVAQLRALLEQQQMSGVSAAPGKEHSRDAGSGWGQSSA